MNQVQTRRYEMLVRVRDFGVAQADQFPTPGLAHDTFTAVADAVEQLNGNTVTKLSSAKGTSTKAKARTALLDLTNKVAQTGLVIAGDTADAQRAFALTKANAADQTLLMRARAIVQAAEPMKNDFIARLLPETFLADLGAAIAALEQAIRQRQAGKDQRNEARNHIEKALAAGDTAARELDAIVANRMGDDPAMMAVWRDNRRVSYPPRRVRRAPAASAAPAAASEPPAPSKEPAGTPVDVVKTEAA